MALLQTVGGFLLVLIILVTVHEFGHFYVARRFGVRVLRFSIGIGKPFWKKNDSLGTEFAVAPWPIGGYVRLLNNDDLSEYPDANPHETIDSKSTMQRIAVLLAGPVANILLAIVVYMGLMMAGNIELSPVVGKVEPGSPADRAGLQEGQLITQVDRQAMQTRSDVLDALLSRLGETGELQLTVSTSGSDLGSTVSLPLNNWLKDAHEPDIFGDLGFKFYRPSILPIVDNLVEGAAAEAAGLRIGDEIVSLDGDVFDGWEAMVEIIGRSAGKAIDFGVMREGQSLSISITPAATTLDDGTTVGRIGVYPRWEQWPKDMLIERQYGLLESIPKSLEKTWSTTNMILLNIKKLLIGQISTKNLSGPIGIAKVAGDSARAGVKYYIEFLALLSVYLGVFNLLPIPMLDGGQIVGCVVRAIKGGDLPDRVRVIVTQVGLAVLGSVMIIAFYNDILRLF